MEYFDQIGQASNLRDYIYVYIYLVKLGKTGCLFGMYILIQPYNGF